MLHVVKNGLLGMVHLNDILNRSKPLKATQQFKPSKETQWPLIMSRVSRHDARYYYYY